MIKELVSPLKVYPVYIDKKGESFNLCKSRIEAEKNFRKAEKNFLISVLTFPIIGIIISLKI